MSDKTPRNLLYNDLYRIPSARMGGHAYDGGAYFVTICTKDRECHFGDIVAGADGEKKMILGDRPICRRTNPQHHNALSIRHRAVVGRNAQSCASDCGD